MTNLRAPDIDEAVTNLLNRGLLGVVVLDPNQRVVGCHGTLVDWVPLDKPAADGIPFLVGYEDLVAEVGCRERGSLALPKVALGLGGVAGHAVYSIHAYPLRRTGGVALVFQDATEIAKLEQRILQQRNELALADRALRQAKNEAEAANRAKSAFLANISHELRTPLNVVIGNAEILLHETGSDFSEEQRATFLSDIRDGGFFLLDLINDLLDLSKAEAGRMDLVEEEVDLGDLIANVVSMASALPYAKGVHLTQQVVPPHPVLFADGRRVKQILLNLLSNAMKFSPEGAGVTVQVEPMADGGLALQVADTGPGIAPRELERLTEAFVQGRAGQIANQGTGLGLHLVKHLVALHDGELKIESQEGIGTRVTVIFPAARVQV